MLVTIVTNGYDVLPAFLANRLSRIDCSDPAINGLMFTQPRRRVRANQ